MFIHQNKTFPTKSESHQGPNVVAFVHFQDSPYSLFNPIQCIKVPACLLKNSFHKNQGNIHYFIFQSTLLNMFLTQSSHLL